MMANVVAAALASPVSALDVPVGNVSAPPGAMTNPFTVVVVALNDTYSVAAVLVFWIVSQLENCPAAMMAALAVPTDPLPLIPIGALPLGAGAIHTGRAKSGLVS